MIVLPNALVSITCRIWVLLFVSSAALNSTAPHLSASEPPAASLAFTSSDATVRQAWQLIEEGEFSKAEQLIKSSLPESDSAKSDSEVTSAKRELLEIARRIRFEYSLSGAELLGKVKKIVPAATAEEVERWASETKARFRMIDGQKMFFRREPQNIFLFSEDAKRCRAQSGNAPAPGQWQLVDHLAEVVQAAERTGQTEVLPKLHRVTHTLTIKNGPHIRQGSQVRVWLPFAQEYRQQRDVRLISASPTPKLVSPNAIDGRPVMGGAQRTVYFEVTVTDPTQPLVFTEELEYTSSAYYPNLDIAKVEALPGDWNGYCLGERPPHIVFDSEIVKKVHEIVGSETNSLVKARKIFRWVSANIPWNAEDEYCTIPSLAKRGFYAGRGDCGVQNTLFMTMCRIAGIPSRWQSGFETKPGDQWGMHDWAEIYIAPWGWLPADASYGVMKSDDPRIADFYCGHQDSYRWIVNLDWGRELYPPKSSLRSEPADFQRGEVEVDGKNLYYDLWSTKTEAQR